MLNLQSGYVNANGIQLHYYTTGGDKPPLVLVHGITDDGLCWLPVAERFVNNYTIYMLDVRGHGKSDAPESGYTLENIGRDLGEFIQNVGLTKPLVLGHSMGAITALVMASLFPDLPQAILLEDPPPFWQFAPSAPSGNIGRNHLATWITSIKRKTWDELMSDIRSASPDWPEAEFKLWVDSKHRCSINILDLVYPSDIVSINFIELVRSITCPALFISADTQRGAISSAADIAALKGAIPQLQTIHIENAGHSIHREQFARYLDVVEDALSNHQVSR